MENTISIREIKFTIEDRIDYLEKQKNKVKPNDDKEHLSLESRISEAGSILSILSSLPTQGTVKSAEAKGVTAKSDCPDVLTPGKEYAVTQTQENCFRIRNDDGYFDYFHSDYFEPLPSNNEAMAPQFDNPIAEARHRAGKRIEEAKKIKVVAPQSQGAVEVIQKRIDECRNVIQSGFKEIDNAKTTLDECASLHIKTNYHAGKKWAYEDVLSLLTTLPPQSDHIADTGKLVQSEVDNGGWISVEERLPETQSAVLTRIVMDGGRIINGVLKHVKEDDVSWRMADDGVELAYYCNVTHWMDIPPLESSPGKATQSGEAMTDDEIEKIVNEIFPSMGTERSKHYRHGCRKALRYMSRSLVSGQLLSSPTSENKEK